MAAEIAALEQNNTRVFTDLPRDKRGINYKWVYKVRHRANGSIKRYKAQLLTKGFTQTKYWTSSTLSHRWPR